MTRAQIVALTLVLERHARELGVVATDLDYQDLELLLLLRREDAERREEETTPPWIAHDIDATLAGAKLVDMGQEPLDASLSWLQ